MCFCESLGPKCFKEVLFPASAGNGASFPLGSLCWAVPALMRWSSSLGSRRPSATPRRRSGSSGLSVRQVPNLSLDKPVKTVPWRCGFVDKYEDNCDNGCK